MKEVDRNTRRKLPVTDGVFSMDGDIAPLISHELQLREHIVLPFMVDDTSDGYPQAVIERPFIMV